MSFESDDSLKGQTHVDVVPVVADAEVGVDALLVDVGDHGHVGHAVLGTAPGGC